MKIFDIDPYDFNGDGKVDDIADIDGIAAVMMGLTWTFSFLSHLKYRKLAIILGRLRLYNYIVRAI